MLSVSGCRGIVGASLTAEVIARYTAATASWLKETTKKTNPTIILANDGRRGGDILRTLAGACLASSGCNIIDLGIATTPTVGVMVVHHKADAGITLTASHNPGEWNGVKIISRQGAAPDAAQAKAIIDLFHSGARADEPAAYFGTVTHDTTSARTHVDRVLHALSAVADLEDIRKCRFKVVVDSVNSSGTQGARLLLDQLGCQIGRAHV